jgi:hypothetical protein
MIMEVDLLEAAGPVTQRRWTECLRFRTRKVGQSGRETVRFRGKVAMIMEMASAGTAQQIRNRPCSPPFLILKDFQRRYGKSS